MMSVTPFQLEDGQGKGMTQLWLVVEGDQMTDASEVGDLTAQLRRRLLELDVETVDLVRSENTPPGAKPADAITIGALVATLAPAALEAVMEFMKSWLENRPIRSATLTIDGDSIELTKTSRSEQDQLLRLFLNKHTQH
jgi:hypothetical protein